ncbi:MAG: anthranilate synthase component I family protein [Pseudomonadota bacterium]
MLVHVTGHNDPVRVATQMRGATDLLWLDSADRAHPAARYSYICFEPVSRLLYTETGVTIDGQDQDGDAMLALRDWLAAFKAPIDPDGPPFQGGAAGYLSYAFGAVCEPHFKSRHALAGPLAQFNMYDTLIAFDHLTDRVSVISAGLYGPNAAPDADLAASRIGRVLARLAEPPVEAPSRPGRTNWQSQDTKPSYARTIEQTKEFIRAGDIYQANIAQTYTTGATNAQDMFANYLELREVSPAPFSAFGMFQGRTLASVSPERLISGSDTGEVIAQPIKGTIRRSSDPVEDASLRGKLESSAKDRAENIMIVDLLRNDLSKVCKPHSVKTPSLCKLETFAGLHHLTSTVTGELRDDQDSIDLLAAVFPGGSITGAPKLRAMQIIDELETSARGAFCGSLGYIGFDGALDFNILIRTIDHQVHRSSLKAGAGITLLSDPETEYDETVLKIAKLGVRSGETEETS